VKSMKNVDRSNNGCDKQEKAQNPHGTYSLFADLIQHWRFIIDDMVVSRTRIIVFQMGSKTQALKP